MLFNECPESQVTSLLSKWPYGSEGRDRRLQGVFKRPERVLEGRKALNWVDTSSLQSLSDSLLVDIELGVADFYRTIFSDRGFIFL